MMKLQRQNQNSQEPRFQGHTFLESLLFSTLFFLIITAYYQVKPASRALFITFVGSENLPYTWILSASVWIMLLPLFSWRAKRDAPHKIVISSTLCIAGLITLFWLLLQTPTPLRVISFYVLVDVYGVILVEQFWGFVGSRYHTSEGKRWYGVIGSGGLVGGICGSALASLLLKRKDVQTIDLLPVAIFFLLLLAVLTWILTFKHKFTVVQSGQDRTIPHLQQRLSRPGRRYVVLIALLLLMSQLVQPIIEFQLMSVLQQVRDDLKARTEYLSFLFLLTSLLALIVNLTITPLFHRYLGTIASLAVQPLLIICGALTFIGTTTLTSGTILKVLDRGLSYSITRASKELLYLPLVPAVIYRIKSWVDMFGYRLFEVFASVLILGIKRWVPNQAVPVELSWVVIALALLWLGVIALVRPRYDHLIQKSEALLVENGTPAG
ncbi:MAG: ATP translocase [Deltaproteobacteria bacterium]|nr:ATP translocase [Deltaproteobacteria bacterium]